jgi:hypothetical protein
MRLKKGYDPSLSYGVKLSFLSCRSSRKWFEEEYCDDEWQVPLRQRRMRWL